VIDSVGRVARVKGPTLPLWGVVLAALLLAGCATSRPGASGPAAGDALSGRLAVRVDAADGHPARSVSAAFDLRGTAESGHLDLATPLGSVMAQARWTPGRVVLSTPQGETVYPDLDALSREVLGESVPVAALFDWLRGRPWSGAASVPTSGAAGFSQLGWTVDLARFDEAWVSAHRAEAPVVSVRARLDRP
jgi:outer membrane lipoprotein LolB